VVGQLVNLLKSPIKAPRCRIAVRMVLHHGPTGTSSRVG
jgi:hypothetical protein